MAILLNLFFRACLLFFMLDSLINASDDRYAGKGLSIRNIVIVVVWSMVFPALFFIEEVAIVPVGLRQPVPVDLLA